MAGLKGGVKNALMFFPCTLGMYWSHFLGSFYTRGLALDPSHCGFVRYRTSIVVQKLAALIQIILHNFEIVGMESNYINSDESRENQKTSVIHLGNSTFCVILIKIMVNEL